MPQLDTSTYITQIFWLFVTFVSFWIIMDKVIIPRIAEMVEIRKRKRDEFILKAEEINKKAIDALKRYEETLAVAKRNMSEQISQNEKELKKIIEDKENEVNLQIQQKITENKQKLAEERAVIIEKADVMAQEVAYNILQQLNLTSITKKDIEDTSSGDNAA